MKTILVVDDEPKITQLVRDYLERAGFGVLVAYDGKKALSLAKTEKPDMVVLDLGLPQLDGLDFTREFRKASNAPIIMLTARAEESDKLIGLELGADDYMTKPFSLRELVSRVRAQLRRAYGDYSSAESAAVVINDLVLDQATGQVRRGDELINLTPIEFRLLSYLARHRGQALSRAQIVEAVWGFAPDIESEKTVNVHIRRLREKIELKPEEPSLILTVPGIGYRMAK